MGKPKGTRETKIKPHTKAQSTLKKTSKKKANQLANQLICDMCGEGTIDHEAQWMCDKCLLKSISGGRKKSKGTRTKSAAYTHALNAWKAKKMREMNARKAERKPQELNDEEKTALAVREWQEFVRAYKQEHMTPEQKATDPRLSYTFQGGRKKSKRRTKRRKSRAKRRTRRR
jgi:hypothetical protein